MLTARQVQRYKPRNFSYGTNNAVIREKGPKRGSSPKPSPNEVNWRESNDYRQEYFKWNKGIGGYLYICSQCFKPLIGRSRIQVDHIVPPSRFAKYKRVRGRRGLFSSLLRVLRLGGDNQDQWVKTSAMARFLNHSFNCAAICADCNRKKSDKINFQIVRGYGMKVVEVTAALTQFALSLPFVALSTTLWFTGKVVGFTYRLAKESRSTNKRRRR